jgi:hypothetical protein
MRDSDAYFLLTLAAIGWPGAVESWWLGYYWDELAPHGSAIIGKSSSSHWKRYALR